MPAETAGAGKLGGFSVPGGTETKKHLLACEGVVFPRHLSDTDFDLKAAHAHLLTVEPAFAEVFSRVPFALVPEPMGSPFSALARAIVFQQLSGKAASTIAGRLKDKLGGAITPRGDCRRFGQGPTRRRSVAEQNARAA